MLVHCSHTLLPVHKVVEQHSYFAFFFLLPYALSLPSLCEPIYSVRE